MHLFKPTVLLLFCLRIFTFNTLYAQNWQQLGDFPSTERDDGVAFVIGNNAYCGTGLNSSFAATIDFYSLDMNTDQWSTIASLPAGNERQYAASFASGNFGFVCGGLGNIYYNDVWQYDPVLNTWTGKTPIPAAGRSGATYFVINNIAYIVGGRTAANVAIDEVWAYDIANDTWQSKNNLPFGSRFRASGAALNNKGYLIFGRDVNARFCQELYEYDPTLDTWTQVSVFPGVGRSYASLQSIAGSLVVLAGLDTFGTSHNDMWSFNVSSSAWQQLNSIPAAGRRGGMCFNNGSAIYYTTGVNQSNTRIKETWKCVNPTSITENYSLQSFTLYPNPASEFIILECEVFKPTQFSTYTLFDNIGNEILQGAITEKKTRINLSSFSKGLYLIRYQDERSCVTMKVVKE